MFKKLLFLAFFLVGSPVLAQQVTCPTRPFGDNSNACASTAFVQSAASSPILNANSVLGNPTGAPAAGVSIPIDTGITDRSSDVATKASIQNFAVPHVNASSYGVVTGGTVDQVANLNTALAAIPAAGGVLDLPCGLIYIGSSWNVTTQNVIINGGGQFCSILYTDAAYLTGNILTLAGNYSTVTNLGFYSGAQPSTIYRTSGIDLNMTGAYTKAMNLTFRGCYICITSAPAAGNATIFNIDITRMTPATTAVDGAAIVVDGPIDQTIMSKVFAFGDSTNTDSPTYGILLKKAGQVNIEGANILGFLKDLVIAPPDGKTVQVVQVSNSAIDSARDCDIEIAPTGTGYVFDVKIVGSYIETANTTADGICMDGSGSSATFPIQSVKIIGNTIDAAFANTPLTANGIYFDANVTDLVISGNTIAGWNNIGVWAKASAHDFHITDNMIGSFNMFAQLGSVTTRNDNFIGLQFDAGATRGTVHGNSLTGNVTKVTNNSTQYIIFDNNVAFEYSTTFAALPVCNANTPNLSADITDGAAAPVYNAAAAGGGAVQTHVVCMAGAWVNR